MPKDFSKGLYKSKEWAAVREAVLKRDFYLCRHCGAAAEEVHHITWLTPNNIGDPSITLNADNLISLCRDCHCKIHTAQRVQAAQKCEPVRFDENGFVISAPAPVKF